MQHGATCAIIMQHGARGILYIFGVHATSAVAALGHCKPTSAIKETCRAAMV